MTTDKLKTFPQAPYFDDTSEDKDFLEVLFRPGLAVQNREMNQLQTLLQKQIARLGNSIFNDGSRVTGGTTQFNPKVPFVRFSSSLALSDITQYFGATVTNAGNTLSAVIVFGASATGLDSDTLYLQYKGVDSADNVSTAFASGAVLTITHNDSSVETATVSGTGFGSTASVASGIFYYAGRFVSVPAQTIIVTKYVPLDKLTYSVGLNMVNTIVTPELDSSLLDNANGSTNYTAPGAHRYTINAKLTLKSSLADVSTYIELFQLQNTAVASVARPNDLSVLGDILAQRTFDEAGNYVVSEFLLTILEDLNNGSNLGLKTALEGGDESLMAYVLALGEAYVRGYQIQTQSNTTLVVPKARTTEEVPVSITTLEFSNYVTVNSITGDVPDLFSKVILRNGAAVNIGTAVVRNFTFAYAGNFNVELIDLVLTAPATDIATIHGLNAFGAFVTSVHISGSNSSLVFPLPFSTVKSLANTRIEYFKQFNSNVIGSTFSLTSTDTFSGVNTDYMVQYTPTGGSITTTVPVSVTPSGGAGNTVSITLLTPSSGSVAISVTCKMIRNGGIPKVKTLTTAVENTVAPGAVIALSNSDIYSITSIIDSVTSQDVTKYYSLDNGQRESVYDKGSLILHSGETVPVNPLNITYKYFQHGIGDYFTVQSYGGLDYKDIPTYTDTNGNVLFLGDVVDFRNKVNSTGVDSNVLTTANAFSANSQLTSDLVHYIPRIDKVVVDTKGKFSVIAGIPNSNPVAPADLSDAMTLYVLNVPAYTFSVKDIKVTKVQQRRYTMADISHIDSRVSNLEYYTSLNLLELNTSNQNFTGVFRNGFIVDTFSTQAVADDSSLDLKCAFDVTNKECRPQCSVKSVSLGLDTASNVTVVDGMVYMAYVEVPAVQQNLASVTSKIQPFARYGYNGIVTLAPSVDNWFTEKYLPDIVHDTGVYTIFENNVTRIARGGGHPTWLFAFGSWRNTWAGVNVAGFGHGANAFTTDQVISKQTIDTGIDINEVQIGNVVVSTSVIPYMRSRDVQFHTYGMKPNSIVKPYFNDIDVSAYCKPFGGSYGDSFIVGPSGLVGGIFTIPNNDALRFKTGIVNFKMVDNVTTPTTEAVTQYAATGVLVERQATYIGTRLIKQVTNSIEWYDPVAESFIITEDGGAFVSSIDVYFGPEVEVNTNQVTVSIRNMVNGYPGSTIVASATLQASELFGSTDATAATRFTFPSPVHIDANTEMCFVVASDSELLTVWTAVMGQKSVMPGDVSVATGQVIGKQPYLGSMFASQNNTTWTALQDQDIKFSIQRAKFNVGTATVEISNHVYTFDSAYEGNVFVSPLLDNSLIFTAGSANVIVQHANHGFRDGDTVVLNGLPGTLNGIPSTELFVSGGLVLTYIDCDFYQITSALGTTAVVSGKNGTDLVATQSVSFSTGYFMQDQLALSGTNISWDMVTTDKTNRTLNGSTNITPKTDIHLTNEAVVIANNDNSLRLVATMTNIADNISPVIDMDRSTFVAVANRVDNAIPSTSNNAAIYIQKPFTFLASANSLKVYVDVNRPAGTNIDVQYATGQSTVSSTWTSMSAVGATPVTTDYATFIENEYEVSGLPDFTTVQVRIVFISENLAQVPRIKNLRVVSLTE